MISILLKALLDCHDREVDLACEQIAKRIMLVGEINIPPQRIGLGRDCRARRRSRSAAVHVDGFQDSCNNASCSDCTLVVEVAAPFAHADSGRARASQTPDPARAARLSFYRQRSPGIPGPFAPDMRLSRRRCTVVGET